MDQITYSALEKNRAICRKDLDFIGSVDFVSTNAEMCQNMSFMKIYGLSSFWESDEDLVISSLMSDVLSGCVRHGVTFAYAIIGDESGISVYIGVTKPYIGGPIASFKALYPGINVELISGNPLLNCPSESGGLFTGIPTNKISSQNKNLQIENICRGMLGKKFSYVILANGLSNIAVSLGHERILEEMEQAYSLINQTITGGVLGNISAQKQSFFSKNYFENLGLLEQMINVGTSRGMWRVNGYFAASNQIDAKQLGNIIKASFSGEESIPEAFRTIEHKSIKQLISTTSMMGDLIEAPVLHPLGQWYINGIKEPIHLFTHKFQTLLNSNQLSVLCQFPTKEFPGYYIDQYVEFDVSNRQHDFLINPFPLGEICIANRYAAKNFQAIGNRATNTEKNEYSIDKNDLTRHALIIGITGGGKTNTTKSILKTLWCAEKEDDQIPFLVIESAKREYWELRNFHGFDDLLLFTLGAETEKTSIKYRINPFETNPNISLQTHIDYLLSTFKAAFDLYPPMPYILEKAVYEIYSDRGWDIVENINHYGFTEYPTLSDLYHKIDIIVDKMGYHSEIQSNVKAALQARVYSLMIGGKGAMLNTPKSVPINELLSRPVVMELEDLGDDETKSFVIGILMVQLYEYRKSLMTKGSKDLAHILVIEEAHRLLKNVTETGEGGNSRAKSVEFFCNLLAEIRTFGQGIIIADQIPTKLAPDTIKNTNLKIVHRTVAHEDRDTIGRAMNMNQEQIDYLSSLPRGFAAVYSEGDNRPKCVKLPLVGPEYEITRDEVITEVKKKVSRIASGYDTTINHHCGCTYCESRCDYYGRVGSYLRQNVEIDKVLERWNSRKYAPQGLTAFLDSDFLIPLSMTNDAIKRCVIGFMLEKASDLKKSQRQEVLADYLKYVNKK